MLVALVLSTALIYYRPGTRTFTAPPGAAIATDVPQYPPGTRYYYRRGQWIPLDQQEAPQE